MSTLPEPIERLLEAALVAELTVVDANGRPAPFTYVNGHIVVPPASLVAGANTIRITFAAGDASLVAARDVDQVDFADGEIGCPERHDRDRRPIRRPLEILDVEARRGHDPRLGRARIAGRPATARNGGGNEMDL